MEEKPMEQKIAVCGERSHERVVLLKGFAQLADTVHISDQTVNETNLRHMQSSVGETSLRFVTLSGAFLYEKPVYPMLFSGSQAVIYIISGVIPTHERMRQKREFERCVKYAEQTNTTWSRIPWLWLITEDVPGDLEEPVVFKNPLATVMPTEFVNNIMVCHIAKREGIDIVWQHLLTIL